MEFKQLVKLIDNEPVFETSLLLAGNVDPQAVRSQLSRWVRAGLIYQIRRGIYTLAQPYQKVKPHPFLIANRMLSASYVSCQSALEYYGLIPEHTPVTVSVTTLRPGHWKTPVGTFEFRHIKQSMFMGYKLYDLGNGQKAFVATPEKALLDLVYLQPGGDSESYLGELRLHNLESLNLNHLHELAVESESQKLRRAARRISILAGKESGEYRTL